ncbi:FAD-binding oxidoreductase [Marinilabiliaceae bacterium JC017]|nr:FAD-binding oxidoreductase [Marinilabiliaceae bacterium JC017]
MKIGAEKIRRLKKEIIRNGIASRQLFSNKIDRLAKGTDAGFYRLIPELVVQVNSEQEVQTVLKCCGEADVPVTFKAAGTSLSGQTITDSVLIEVGSEFSAIKITDEGRMASFQPGVRGGFANQQLAKYGRKIGPSPASINAAKIGGIVANNASGSSYGITTNSYNTIRGMRLVLADGTLLDTMSDQSRRDFERTQNELLRKVTSIRDRVRENPRVADKIKAKYQLKNTTGYGMNTFVDYTDPIDIIQHLMVGSEGTLGFISDVTFETVANHPYKTCALLFLRNIRDAAAAVIPLRQCEVSAAELMDRNALRAVQDVEGMPALLKDLDDEAAALLIETSAPTAELLSQQMETIKEKLSGIDTLFPITFTDNAKDYNTYWKVRKGLFTSAAAVRPKGTACIIEDVAFPGEVLGDALMDLKKLQEEHHYSGSVMWGHLLDGNIHFLIMPDFTESWQMDNYKQFMHDLADLVVNRYNGSLKAEHGTGRNMAPFVEDEWGSEIYALMKEVKAVLDPKGLLNPGVLINDDKEIFAKNIKPLPEANPIVDACIECGFCESNCPSRDFTLAARQRIVVYRELTRLRAAGQTKELRQLAKAFQFKGTDSCATDGLCALNCPVGINTGKLIKELRFDKIGTFSDRIANLIARNFGRCTQMARGLLRSVALIRKVIPEIIIEKVALGLHYLSGRNTPVWNTCLPTAAPKVKSTDEMPGTGLLQVVYFPACINRMFGVSLDYDEKVALINKTKSLLGKAGYSIIYPENINDLCCGMAFDSKGYRAQGMDKLHELEAALLKASNNGQLPVLCDMSPCLLRMKELMDKRLKLYEPVEFTLTYLTDKLVFEKLPETVMVHSTCSNTKMGLGDHLVKLAGMCAQKVIRPEKTGCCGWAGDKGFNMPELNKSALRYLKEEIPDRAAGGYSTSRTCEIGLTKNSGLSYKSILYLVDRATKPKSGDAN